MLCESNRQELHTEFVPKFEVTSAVLTDLNTGTEFSTITPHRSKPVRTTGNPKYAP